MRGNNDAGKGGGIHEVKIFGGLDNASFIHPSIPGPGVYHLA